MYTVNSMTCKSRGICILISGMHYANKESTLVVNVCISRWSSLLETSWGPWSRWTPIMSYISCSCFDGCLLCEVFNFKVLKTLIQQQCERPLVHEHGGQKTDILTRTYCGSKFRSSWKQPWKNKAVASGTWFGQNCLWNTFN